MPAPRAFPPGAADYERLFQALFDSNVVGVTLTGEEEIFDANDAFLDMLGYSRADLAAGLRWTELSAPESAETDRLVMERLHREGVAPPFEKEYVRRDGSRVTALLSGTRIAADPLLVLATIYDLSERRAAEREIRELLDRERAAGRRTARLQQITEGLSAARSPEQIARVVVHHALEELSASAGMLVRLEGAEIEVAYAIGYDREMIERWRRFPLAAGTPLGDAIRDGTHVCLTSREDMQERYPDVREDESPHHALVACPLAAGDRVLGAVGLSFRRPRELPAADLELLHAICGQAGVALERAQLFENRAYVAGKLQEGLLPRRLPAVPGLEVAVRYESIAGRGEVGGDFYDLVESGEERWTLALGDVAGKGTEAAVVTGLARHTLRAIARLRERPAEILRFLNDALRRHDDEPPFCTVGCAVLRPAGGGFRAVVASGGHPFPLVLRAGGEVEEVEVGGTMLGVVEDPRLDEVEVGLAPGDALVVYTDGVLDARAGDGERFGEERLRAALAGARGADAEGVAGAIESAIAAHDPGTPADDRAVVVLRASP